MGAPVLSAALYDAVVGEDEQPLAGGIANLGAVVRVGDTVRRPASRFTASIGALLEHLRGAGFPHVPRLLGTDEHRREVLTYIEGDVPVPPFPAGSMTDETLASVARLHRRFHDAVEAFDASRFGWSDELADPEGGELLCHNDICPENVVFRDGEAVALLDWDFAAPGRRLWDVAATMSLWGPVRDPSDPVPGMEGLDPFARASLIADAYGLDADERARLPRVFVDRLSISLVERRAAAGERAFVEMIERQGGPGRARRRREWLEANMPALTAALTG
jgi:hypothetical protein